MINFCRRCESARQSARLITQVDVGSQAEDALRPKEGPTGRYIEMAQANDFGRTDYGHDQCAQLALALDD